ncbi:MAG: hypothetical protein ACOX5Q_01145 [Bacillota bacterium]|jgi:hypothetical protein|nr:hypothetical protein [Candidatus Fermentithermobacillaceae bacterium]
MAREKYRFRMYESLAKAARTILDKAQGAAGEGAPNAPLRPPEAVSMSEPSRLSDDDPADIQDLIGRIRELVKDTYGDSYDACPIGSTSAGLALCRAIAVPDRTIREHKGRLRASGVAVVPRQKPSELFAESRPLPPKYSLLPEFRSHGNADAASSDLAAAVVPLVGASYSYHGIVPGPVAMVAKAQAEPSLEAVAATAEACLPHLAAIFALGTSVPGCGFTEANDDGLPELHVGLGEMAAEYDVPFIIDNSPGIPFLGPDLGKAMISAAVFGPFGPGGPGLVIGVEELVLPILQLAGAAGHRAGKATSGMHVAPPVLPGKDTLRDMLGLMNETRHNPERFGRVVDRIYDIATSEFAHLNDDFKRALRFMKNYATLSVEINYEDTWNDSMGFPVFSAEDAAAGTHLLREGLKRMGVTSISVVDAGIVIGIPRHTLKQALDLPLDPERLRKEVQDLVSLVKIIGEAAGYPV